MSDDKAKSDFSDEEKTSPGTIEAAVKQHIADSGDGVVSEPMPDDIVTAPMPAGSFVILAPETPTLDDLDMSDFDDEAVTKSTEGV